MTTPERLRRRQRIEGTALVILGVGMVIQSAYFDHRDEENDRCMAEQFHHLSVTLGARADITQREADEVAKVLITAANAKTSEQVAKALAEYNVARQEIDAQRKANPLPKFPSGRCTGNGQPNGVFLSQGNSGGPRIGPVNRPYAAGVGGHAERPVTGAETALRGAAAGHVFRDGRLSGANPGPQPDRPRGSEGPSPGGPGPGDSPGVNPGAPDPPIPPGPPRPQPAPVVLLDSLTTLTAKTVGQATDVVTDLTHCPGGNAHEPRH